MLPACVKDGTNDHPRSVTSALTRARPFMDDIGATPVVRSGSLAMPAEAAPSRAAQQPGDGGVSQG
jgi:hypothetical protein